MLAKKHYSVRETYWIAHHAVRTARFMARTGPGRDPQFRERIMLTVTEVNGCELCSYAHIRFAVEAGMSHAEIRALLGGAAHQVPDHQLSAIAFAQHYADTRGHPDTLAWREIVEAYGETEALGVLAAARIMMWGNALGIPLSSLRSRLKGTPHPESSTSYEVRTFKGSILLTPVALAHALLSELRHEPITPPLSGHAAP
jgi:AhpD family alkylhydroperoxidase